MTNQLTSLFSQLEMTIGNRMGKGRKLKLDFNSLYGGYRIDIVEDKNGATSAFYFSNRISRKEMIAFIQGYLVSIDQHCGGLIC